MNEDMDKDAKFAGPLMEAISETLESVAAIVGHSSVIWQMGGSSSSGNGGVGAQIVHLVRDVNRILREIRERLALIQLHPPHNPDDADLD